MTNDLNLIADRVRQIRPLLAGLESHVQGAILADLLAMWLAGHGVRGDSAATDDLREDLLDAHLGIVTQLIPENAKLLGTNR
jgi:hypothetical protein